MALPQKNNGLVKQFYIVLLLNFLATLFIAKRYLSFLEDTDGFLTKIYLVLATTSHFLIISTLPFLLTLLLYFCCKKKYLSIVFNILFSVLGLLYIQIDTIVFGQFRYHISPMVLKMAFGTRASDIFQFSTQNILMAIAFVIGLVTLQLLFHFTAGKIQSKNYNLRIKQSVLLFLMFTLFSNSIYAWSDANYYGSITQTKEVFPVYFPLTADSLLLKLGLVDLERSKNKSVATENTSNTIAYPSQPIRSDNPVQKNIIYIVIDTWRWDCMTAEITPNIYAFAKKSIVFDNHMSGSNMTTGGIFSLFYGIPATYFQNFTTQQIAPVLMNELQKQKYQFHVFASSTLENPPFNRNVFANISTIPLFTEGNSPDERDLKINELFTAAISKQDKKQPFFSFLFYDSAHGFDYPENYKKPFSPDLDQVNYLDLDDDYDPKLLINRYKNALHYVDSLIGKTLKELEDKKLLDNSIIVITSDHGQEFNDLEKGYWQHGGNFSDYQVKVPMLIFDGSKKPRVEKRLTLHYDVAPTILSNYLGVKNKMDDYSFGTDLFTVQKDRKYFICGYNQKFSIIQSTKITNVSASGTLNATDKKLNKLEDEQIDYNIVLNGIQSVNKFYKKK
ncbi:DUF3413 domain-containing protein [Flavobacterium antarcticum]|uniref:DUF3413 domain-containing protein n=1 Tax=Flavobacterium antarcticum TaxID=271155 RepID=UPI0003B3874B|nr:DUF3413 domain-containing protein [Flavobacterium antarcticum]